ncbi:HNH endonuclease, partial [Bacillus nitratireducens]
DDALVLEGFLGAAGSAISGIAIGAMKVTYLALELGEWGFNSIRGVETEQWKLDDIYGAGNTIKNLGQAIISWQDYPKYGKALVNSVKGYVEKALTDPYALGGAIFDIGSCFIGVGEVTAAVKGGKLAQGAKVFQVAAKNSKIVGKLEEVTALINKLPSSIVEKIKNIEIPNVFPEPALAGIGKSGGGGLDSLKDAYQFMKETGEKVFGKGTGKLSKTDFDKEVDKAMGEAGRNQPEYNRKPIQPRDYKKMEINEDGTTTYTVVSKSNGKEYKVTYDKNGHPIFNDQFDTTLPESKYLSSDSEQFTFCNKDLFDKAMKDPELKSKFTVEELELFKEGKKPSNYTWHHHQDIGKMQLVDYFEHEAAKHTGGRAYWGGGKNGRNGKIKRDIANRIRELFS